MWMGRRSTDKRYPGDNRLIGPKSPYRRTGLAPQQLGCGGRNAVLVSAYNGEPRDWHREVSSGQYRGKSVGSAADPAAKTHVAASASDPVTTEAREGGGGESRSVHGHSMSHKTRRPLP